MIEAAIQSEHGILHSDECVRKEAGDGPRILVDPFVVQPNGVEVPLLPEGTICSGRFVTVRRRERAKVSKTWTGAVVIELTPKGHTRYEFYAHLEVLEPQTAKTAGIGCGAEGGGVLIKRGRRWLIARGTQWPDLKGLGKP
jgi:hypothetical protein